MKIKRLRHIMIWFIGCITPYIIPSGIGAFVQLDWSCFDFTTWKEQSREILSFFVVVWTVLFLFMKKAGVFD